MIDNVRLEQQTTFAPTASPTIQPTPAQTIGSTPEPTVVTHAPTTSLVIPCPEVGETVELSPGSVILGIADVSSLCSVTKVISRSNTVIPLVRSYDLNEWETSPGDVAASHFDNEVILCYDQGCQINLPNLESGETYILTTKTYSTSNRDEFARFLETASFGSTASELDNMEAALGDDGPMGVIVDYVESQMDENIVPATIHREFWRRRANPRVRFLIVSCVFLSLHVLIFYYFTLKYIDLSPLFISLLGQLPSVHLPILVQECQGGESLPSFAMMNYGGHRE